ncbi:unnamed protein product [Paramecium octaurelia]|uniref:Uncharacterized protein n=1 Tax=Paramecium octaurelia TaxID=43137 RepID=A0A8S1T5Q6_PAROT|nr:unnamed protein product [Paramecium octaurelia]
MYECNQSYNKYIQYESTIQRGILENQSLSISQIAFTQCYRQSIFQVQGELQFSLSQEMVTSRTQRNLVKPKLQAVSHKKEDSKNFYHHSTIYNVNEFKELSKPQDYNEPNQTKYNQMQTKMMVADFKKKVDAILQKNIYKTNLSSKIPSSLYELESFQSTNNEEQLNKSLCSNKFTIRTEYKSMKATEILVISNNRVVSRQIITSELIQQRLLKQMENFLKDDRYNYDLKMQIMIDQYEDIVNRIRQKAYTIRIPQNYQIQLSDYNEFYQKTEEAQIPFINDKFELLADQIIQEIQQSRPATPILQKQINEEEQQEEHFQQIDEIVKTEPVYFKEEVTPQKIDFKNEQVPDRKLPQRRAKPRKKQQQQQQQKQNESVSETSNPQSQQSSQSELQDISSIQQFHKKNEIRNNQQVHQTAQIQQQHFETDNQQQYESTQNQHYVQNTNKKHATHEKHKGKVHSRKLTGDTGVQRQVPKYLDVPREELLETLSEKSHEETFQFEDIQTKKQESFKQEDSTIKLAENQDNEVKDVKNSLQETNQQAQPQNKQLHGPEQRDAVDIWDNTNPAAIKVNPKAQQILQENKQIEQKQNEDVNANQNKQCANNVLQNLRKPSMNVEQSQTQQEVVNNKPLKSYKDLDKQRNIEIPQTYDLPKIDLGLQKIEIQKQEEPKSIRAKQEIVETKEQTDDSKDDILQIINEKMKIFEQKDQEKCLDIFDILLASDSVYNVDIEKDKVSKSYKKQVSNLSFVFQQLGEEEVFSHQVIWRHELQEVMPKLEHLNKHIVVMDQSDDQTGANSKGIEELNDKSENQLM